MVRLILPPDEDEVRDKSPELMFFDLTRNGASASSSCHLRHSITTRLHPIPFHLSSSGPGVINGRSLATHQ
jgi:hypothetical protein